ncbi:hypothetical protein BJX76DRAFT_353564 [Aspergillus varians]
MALKTFHLFCNLPFDLRREIYMMATPPRVVHIQEDAQDEEEFKEQFQRRIKIRLNSDLAYFAPNWRGGLPGPIKQRTLEEFGVTSSRGGPDQPWEPSASTPEIPLRWLQDQPRIASQIMRENSLYSVAPIPPLLHSWCEARLVLMRWGYTLAFETRTKGPRTWFHFDRDVLFIERSSTDEYDVLTESRYTILGQFHSKDLKRVRTLALGASGGFLYPWKRYNSYESLMLTIRLFPDLRELQIVQWEENDLYRWRNFGKSGSAQHPWCTAVDDLVGELYSLPVEEIDGLLSLLSYVDGIRSHLSAAGVLGESLRFYRQRTDTNGLGFFEYQQQQLEERLTELREKTLQEMELGLSTFSWRIPRVTAVHIIPPSMATQLQQERQVAWEMFTKMKQKWSAMAHKERAPPLHPEALVSWTDLDVDDVHMHDVHLGPYSEIDRYGNALDVAYRYAKQWWAEEGMIAAPSSEVLF